MMPLDARNDIHDDALMVLFANGDGAAASVLAMRHVPRVLAQAHRMLRDPSEAEDVAQEAMMRLWKVAPDWRQGEAKVSTWLYRVTANLCTDRLRKKKPIEMVEVPEPLDDAPSVEADLMGRDRAQALRAALQKLPARQGLALELRFLQDMNNPEVAEIMEISVDAVESLLGRGKKALARNLAEQKEGLGWE